MNNKILGIAGGALLIIGIFLPIVSLMGFGISYFDGIKADPAKVITGIGVLVMGIIGLVFALTGKFRLLILPGIVALGLLILDFFRLKSSFSGAGDADMPPELASAVSIGWGMYVMILGAILLIVAGVMKNTAPAINPGWGAPPPPPPYPPAR